MAHAFCPVFHSANVICPVDCLFRGETRPAHGHSFFLFHQIWNNGRGLRGLFHGPGPGPLRAGHSRAERAYENDHRRRWLFVIVGALLCVVVVLSLIRGMPLIEMLPLMLVLLMKNTNHFFVMVPDLFLKTIPRALYSAVIAALFYAWEFLPKSARRR